MPAMAPLDSDESAAAEAIADPDEVANGVSAERGVDAVGVTSVDLKLSWNIGAHNVAMVDDTSPGRLRERVAGNAYVPPDAMPSESQYAVMIVVVSVGIAKQVLLAPLPLSSPFLQVYPLRCWPS